MKTLHPYQVQATTFLINRDRALLLADMGAGKTTIALHAVQPLLELKVCFRVWVFAPALVADRVEAGGRSMADAPHGPAGDRQPD